ncbi:DUF2514 family protein [Kaistia sp. MMO-174]|uniref:DUF2514 family protein n=1 Tax=Kaistia sp. MMO-174 TaxID=3081256 RepID=UPI003019DFE6
MIAALLSPIGRWVGGALFVLAFLAGFYAYGYRHGRQASDQKWQAAMAAEQTRQAAVRAKALDEAVARELARAAENEQLEAQVNQYEADLAKSLSKAPAGSCDYRLRGADVERLHMFQRPGSAAP